MTRNPLGPVNIALALLAWAVAIGLVALVWAVVTR